MAEVSVANHLNRIAQEVVDNALKRGRAKRVRIRIALRSRQIRLSVMDDGIGMGHQTPPKKNGIGLKIMAYRAGLMIRERGITAGRMLFL